MAESESEQPILNANQQRNIEVMVTGLDLALAEIQRLISDAGSGRSLSPALDDLPTPFQREAPVRIERLRADIDAVATQLKLPRRTISRRRSVRAMLSAQLVRVEDVNPSKLRSYGTVDARVAEEIMPLIRDMHTSLAALLRLLDQH